MANYLARFQGQNFLLNLSGTTEKCGFFATRLVTTENVDLALKELFELVAYELGDNILNEHDDHPTLKIEWIEPTGEEEYSNQIEGFTFYTERESLFSRIKGSIFSIIQ